MKINNQANRDKKKAKYEVGNFCTQYGLPSIAPSKRNSRKERYPRERTDCKYYRHHKKSNNFSRDDFYKKNWKTKDYHKVNKKDPAQKDMTKRKLSATGVARKVILNQSVGRKPKP